MINLSVDEAYAFDYLAILEIKKDLNPSTQNSWLLCTNFLKDQLGDLLETIILSSEYQNLLSINQDVFNAVDSARYGQISAKEVDNKNMQRYYAKKALQEKFFPTKLLTEYKT